MSADSVEVVLTDEEGGEDTYLVEYDYTPGCKSVRTHRNGDPGEPDEPPEVEITCIRQYYNDMSLSDDVTKNLNESDLEKCVDAAYQHEYEKEAGEYDDYDEYEDDFDDLDQEE